MSFYGEMPDNYNFTLNTNHPVVIKAINDAENALDTELKPLEADLNGVNAEIKALHDLTKDNKELDADKKQELQDKEKQAEDIRNKEKDIITKYADGQSVVKQLVDVALLSNGLLKGEDLANFLKRSVDLLK